MDQYFSTRNGSNEGNRERKETNQTRMVLVLIILILWTNVGICRGRIGEEELSPLASASSGAIFLLPAPLLIFSQLHLQFLKTCSGSPEAPCHPCFSPCIIMVRDMNIRLQALPEPTCAVLYRCQAFLAFRIEKIQPDYQNSTDLLTTALAQIVFDSSYFTELNFLNISDHYS